MNISKRQNGELNAIITIEVKPEDYQPKVDEIIKSYRKTATIPGFRPGHVPAGIIKKKFGKEVLVEELNKILGEELYNYLRENKIEVLGSPIPVQKTDELIIEEGKEYSFDYEIGLAPVFEVKMPKNSIPFYRVKVDEKMIEEDLNDIRRRYGKFSNPEVAEESSVLYGEFEEVDENGNPKEGANKTTTTLSIEMLRDENEKKKFVGAKKDDVIRFNPMKATQNQTEVAAMLRVEKDNEALHSDYNYTIKTVNKIEKAELNQELFDKVLGEGAASSEEEFKNKIKEGIASFFEKDSDRKFKTELRDVFLEENNFSLPDDFLKRMLKTRQEKQITDQEFDHEYFHLAEDLKWNLIQEKISSQQSFTIAADDIKNAARLLISQQFAQYGMPPPEDDKMEEMVMGYLNKDDNEERLQRILIGQKVFDYLKQAVSLNVIEMPYAEFVEKMKEKTQHEMEHHH